MKTKYLNEVAEIRAGNSAPQGKEPFNNGRFNFYRTFDVGQVKQGEISVSRDKVNKETYTNLKKFQIYGVCLGMLELIELLNFQN